MRATFEWIGPTGRCLCKGTVYGSSTQELADHVVEMALNRADLHKPPVVKWNRLVITIYNSDRRSTPHERVDPL